MGYPPPKEIKLGGRTHFFCQKWKKSKLLKITWNGKKIVRKWFLEFLAPHPKINWGAYKNFCQKWKKSKFFKIAWNGEKIGRKWFLDFLAPTKKNLGGVHIFFGQKWKKSFFFNIAWNGKKTVNCLKWQENWLKTNFGAERLVNTLEIILK